MTNFLRLSTGYIYGGENGGGDNGGHNMVEAVDGAAVTPGEVGSGAASVNTFLTAVSASSSFVTGDQLGAPFLYVSLPINIIYPTVF